MAMPLGQELAGYVRRGGKEVVHQWIVRVDRTLVPGALRIPLRRESRRWIPFIWRSVNLEEVACSREATRND